MSICFIKKTGQSVLGTLRYEGIRQYAGWHLNYKGKRYWKHSTYVYVPIFECGEPAKRFEGYSEIIVDDKTEFTAYYCDGFLGIGRLIGKAPIDELPSDKN